MAASFNEFDMNLYDYAKKISSNDADEKRVENPLESTSYIDVVRIRNWKVFDATAPIKKKLFGKPYVDFMHCSNEKKIPPHSEYYFYGPPT